MRILMLSPHPTVRGPLPRHTPVLVEALGGLGCDVRSEAWGRHADEDSLGGRVLSRARDIRRFRALVRADGFDACVVKSSHEWISLLRDIPLLLVVRRAVPLVVVQFHGGHTDWLSAPRRWLFKLATRALLALSDGVLVLSSQEAEQLRAFEPRGRFHVVANPFVSRPELATTPPVASQNGAATIVFASRLVPEKGVLDVIEAFPQMYSAERSRLVIAGSGPAEPAARRRIEELGLAGKIEMVGYLDGPSLDTVLRAADVFVLPTYWAEGFPTVISEAMDAGLPIVTTRLRGMADHLREGENALFVEPRDPTGIARALDRLLDDAPARQRMGRANKARVAAFAPDAVAEGYLGALGAISDGR